MDDVAPAVAHAGRELRRLLQGRKFLTATPDVGSAVGLALGLRALGADVMAMGAAPFDAALRDDIPTLDLGLSARGIIGLLHAGESALDTVPASIIERIDAWDPTREARAARALFSEGRPVAGRSAWGGRPKAWATFDDKTMIDALWDAAGVPRAPRQVVPAEAGALAAAHRQLDAGHGTVWAIDNREGWHGAAHGVRWVHDAATEVVATAFAQTQAHTVRVMPFLEGRPCSIHGLVFPGFVMVLRPCELVILRDVAQGRFVYATASTTWDPPAEGRAAMRALARQVGRHLAATHGYRGAFTIDGVWTADGFRPTELNPRYGAALGMIGSLVAPTLNLYALHLALVEEEPASWQPEALEAALVDVADANRRTGSTVWLPGETVERKDGALTQEGGGWRFVDDPEAAVVQVHTRIHPAGPILRVHVEPSFLAPGAPVAPVLVSVIEFLNGAWSLGLPTLEAAPEAE
ncbi:MAG: hypothetical protein AAGA48_34005 [Myxococcota bacterium]